MSGNQQNRRPKKKAPANAKTQGGNKGGQKRKKKGKKKGSKSAVDPKRPIWTNPDGEAEVRETVGEIRPALHPDAVIRSLGEPPLGKYASTAHHYYEAVYEKAQHFAVAIATANGLLVVDETEDDSGAEPRGNTEPDSE
ncbi:MAG: hypothetical protein GY812_04095 [Actinomycetia bacterium]|nr:hypothetical protein [Actinomycetes bacterium]